MDTPEKEGGPIPKNVLKMQAIGLGLRKLKPIMDIMTVWYLFRFYVEFNPNAKTSSLCFLFIFQKSYN